MKNKAKKCIKGFDSELKCLGFQYEVGKSYKLPEGEQVKICEKGFHAIDEDENPLAVFGYYPPCGDNGKPNRYCEVEIGGETAKRGEKIVGSEIRVVREICIQGVIDAHKEWAKRHPDVVVSEKTAHYSVASNTGWYSIVSNMGDNSVAFNTSHWTVALNSGGFSVASNMGDNSVAYNTGGNRSVASNMGDNSVAYNTGNRSIAYNTGNRSIASNDGERSISVSGGFNSSASVEGKNSVAVVTGKGGRVKGASGCAIMAVERDSLGSILSCASAIVDGVNIKADTWYKCKNGELVEDQ